MTQGFILDACNRCRVNTFSLLPFLAPMRGKKGLYGQFDVRSKGLCVSSVRNKGLCDYSGRSKGLCDYSGYSERSKGLCS